MSFQISVRNVAIPISYMYKLVNVVSTPYRKYLHLKHMLQRIGGLPPCTHQLFMTFTHLEIYILVHIAGNEDIMLNTFLIMRKCTPKIPMECLKERECRAVKATVKIRRRVRVWNSFNP